jgi:hypothetical protein
VPVPLPPLPPGAAAGQDATDPLGTWLGAVYHWVEPRDLLTMADEFRECGWTDATLLVTTDLARWAVQHRTGAATWLTAAGDPIATVPEAWMRLVLPWKALAEPGGSTMTLDEVAAWIIVLAGTPDPYRYETMRHSMLGHDGNPFHGREMNPFDFLTWQTLGAFGAYAYAADLDLAEASVVRAGGDVSLKDLRLLAGLRGWLFPTG